MTSCVKCVRRRTTKKWRRWRTRKPNRLWDSVVFLCLICWFFCLGLSSFPCLTDLPNRTLNVHKFFLSPSLPSLCWLFEVNLHSRQKTRQCSLPTPSLTLFFFYFFHSDKCKLNNKKKAKRVINCQNGNDGKTEVEC